MTTSTARTVSVTIARDPKELYAFVRDASNFPQWISFCKAIRREEDGWRMSTDAGAMTVRFVEDNPFGVLDHFVRADSATHDVYLPMRVVANGSGSEVMLTVFRAPSMSDNTYADDVALVEEDLAALKRLFERR